jgi:hypothetical protein
VAYEGTRGLGTPTTVIDDQSDPDTKDSVNSEIQIRSTTGDAINYANRDNPFQSHTCKGPLSSVNRHGHQNLHSVLGRTIDDLQSHFFHDPVLY